MQILQIDSRCDGARIKTKVTLDGDHLAGQQAFLEAANRHRLMLSDPPRGEMCIGFYTVTLYMEDETSPVWLQEIGGHSPEGNTWVIEAGPDHQGLNYRQEGLIGTAATLDDV